VTRAVAGVGAADVIAARRRERGVRLPWQARFVLLAAIWGSSFLLGVAVSQGRLRLAPQLANQGSRAGSPAN